MLRKKAQVKKKLSMFLFKKKRIFFQKSNHSPYSEKGKFDTLKNTTSKNCFEVLSTLSKIFKSENVLY